VGWQRWRGGARPARRLAEALFAELNRQLDAKGLVLKASTLIYATLVEAAVARPPQSEGEVSTKDPEAGFTVSIRQGPRGCSFDLMMPVRLPAS
jgi:hypothetical protein